MQLIDIHTHRPTEAVTILTVGVHPWHVAGASLPSVEQVQAADAVGEIGLDKACEVDFECQKRLFERQLALAELYHKPVVLHCVRAFEEMMTMLEKHRLKAVIFHGFIGSREQAERAVKKGHYLSFGARTECSRKTVEALRATPLDRLFAESDEAETPLIEIYETIARLRGIEQAELELATAENYHRIFKTTNE